MKSLSLKDRGRALEDVFFQGVNQKLLADLRLQISEEKSQRALRKASGIWNEEVLAELVHLGVEPETLLAIGMIPLVAVAWADGNVTSEERQRILEAEKAQHIDAGSATDQLLNHWLDNNPGPGMFEAWQHFINELRGQFSAARGTLFDTELIERAEAVAKASGGYWTYGAISPSEKKMLEEIKATLKAAG